MSDPDFEVLETAVKDPGASRHGNFMNYYQFHPAQERVDQLPKEGLLRILKEHQTESQKYVVLDVGCNAGVRCNFIFLYLSINMLKNCIRMDNLSYERNFKQLFRLMELLSRRRS